MIKVLVVDDEAEICDFLKNFFTEKKYDVQTATSGEEALFQVRKDKPHVMLLDIKMPGISGIEVLRQVKQIDRSIKVIMVTVIEDRNMVDLAKEFGADDYVTKPFSLEYLERDVMKKIVELLAEKAR